MNCSVLQELSTSADTVDDFSYNNMLNRVILITHTLIFFWEQEAHTIGFLAKVIT